MKAKYILTLAEVTEILTAARNEAVKQLGGRDRWG